MHVHRDAVELAKSIAVAAPQFKSHLALFWLWLRRTTSRGQVSRQRRVLSKYFTLACATLLLTQQAMAGDSVTFFYTDGHGTVLAKADATGALISSSDYRPYGAQALGAAEAGPGYTGHVNDVDSGLVYMQARYYDPTVGRFLSADPVASKAGDVFNFNRHAYANNNPINRFDPDGKVTCDENSCTLESNSIAGRALEYIYVGGVITVRLVQNAISGNHPHIQQSQDNSDGNVKVAPALPTGLIGSSPEATRKNRGTAIGTSLPSDKFADTVKALTGGVVSTPDGTGRSVAPNGVGIRTGGPDGPRIDIPANGSKAPEIVHFPKDTPIPDNLKPTP